MNEVFSFQFDVIQFWFENIVKHAFCSRIYSAWKLKSGTPSTDVFMPHNRKTKKTAIFIKENKRPATTTMNFHQTNYARAIVQYRKNSFFNFINFYDREKLLVTIYVCYEHFKTEEP